MQAGAKGLRYLHILTLISISLLPRAIWARDLKGPARFCGYSPIIDLRANENVTILEGGIHGGTFRWSGAFGSLDVSGIGWASPPVGRIEKPLSDGVPARFAQRRQDGRFVIAIWNGRHGAAYFRSQTRFTAAHIEAIDRVKLYEEGETPTNCNLRTTFSWE
jgi:hypothetical protein